LNGAVKIGVEGGSVLLRNGGELIVQPALVNGAGKVTVSMEWLNR